MVLGKHTRESRETTDRESRDGWGKCLWSNRGRLPMAICTDQDDLYRSKPPARLAYYTPYIDDYEYYSVVLLRGDASLLHM